MGTRPEPPQAWQVTTAATVKSAAAMGLWTRPWPLQAVQRRVRRANPGIGQKSYNQANTLNVQLLLTVVLVGLGARE